MGKKKQNISKENCEEFGRILGMNVQDWWMGLMGTNRRKIKKIDEGPEED